MNPTSVPIPIRQTHCEWPEWSMLFTEYNDHTVAVAVRRRDQPSRAMVCNDLESAVAYAQSVVRFTNFIRQLFKGGNG